MKHNYTDEEIRTAWKDALSLREFLDALPARLPPLPKSLPPRPPRPEPKASQQEAIDAAFLDSRHISLWAVADSPYWEKEAPDRLALAQVYEQVRPQSAEMVELRAELDYARKTIEEKSAEIASLKAERDKLDTKLAEIVEAAEKAEAELAAMRQPILADAGISLGQVQGDAWISADNAGHNANECNEISAQAVAAVVLAQAVRRMEAVPVEELWYAYEAANTGYGGMGAVRARLIAAANGEGQAQPVVVNEPPKSEGQPDLSGESEKQPDKPATFEAHGKVWTRHTPGDPMPCDGDKDVEIVRGDGRMPGIRCGFGWNWVKLANPSDEIIGWRYADEPAQAKPEPAQPWTPAVGDTVRLKSGGPVMTVAYKERKSIACNWIDSSGQCRANWFPAACLTPVSNP